MFLNHKHIHKQLDCYSKTGNIPNILFHGPTGSGKSSIIDIFIKKIYNQDSDKIKKNTKYIDCTHSNGIQFIREDLKFFAQSIIHENTLKIIILQNADNLTIDAQSALRRHIEIFIKTTRFFIDITNKDGLIKPILSRFCSIYIPSPISDSNKNVHLYKPQQNSTLTKILSNKHDNIRKKIQYLLKQNQNQNQDADANADAANNIHVSKSLCIAESLYNSGVSCFDIIQLLENGVFSQNDLVFQTDFLYAFNNLQKKIRCEKLLMATIIHSIIIHTNIIQPFELDG